MANLTKVHSIMPLRRAMLMYGSADKQKFECAYHEYQTQRPDSSFYADFSVADYYGEKAIEDTYTRCFSGWKTNVKMFTELVATLNHKLWFWHEARVFEYSKLYDRLWKEADAYGCDTFKDEEAKYFYSVLD